jgi:hypothetical protein
MKLSIVIPSYNEARTILTLLRALLEAGGWIVAGTERVRPLHLLALARRPGPGENSFPAASAP